MQKRAILFLLVFISIPLALANADITGEVITGKALSQHTNVSIFVIPSPQLVVYSPQPNKTYLWNSSIPIDFFATNANKVWYSLDNGPNILITSKTNLSTFNGAHVFRIYANSSYGILSRTVTFFVNQSRFFIKCDKPKDPAYGNTTNFLEYPQEDLKNMSNVILENINYGRIRFKEPIKVIPDDSAENETIDIDSNFNISFNRIEVNSTALPNFNKSATLYFYNLSLTNPRILKDGQVCSDCGIENYSGGLLTFNVTSFSVYTTEETPAGTPNSQQGSSGSSSSSSGSNRSISLPAPSKGGEISIDKDLIKLKIKQGEFYSEKLTVTNFNSYNTTISISCPELQKFFRIEKSSFELKSGESRELSLDFVAMNDANPNLYEGDVIIKSGNKEKKVLVILEIVSKHALFDLKISIPEKFTRLNKGEDILATVNILDLGKTKRVDVNIEYLIKDSGGNTIVYKEETKAVMESAGFVKTFQLPDNIKDGMYILYIRITYEGQTASASSLFYVGSTLFTIDNLILSLIILIAVISVIRFGGFLYSLKKSMAGKKKETLGSEAEDKTQKTVRTKPNFKPLKPTSGVELYYD